MTPTLTDLDTDLAALDDLGDELGRRGYLTMIVAAGARPGLEVLDRAEAGRRGTVLCVRDAGGTLWFWWSWADRIAPAGELERAVAAVDRDLRPLAGTA